MCKETDYHRTLDFIGTNFYYFKVIDNILQQSFLPLVSTYNFLKKMGREGVEGGKCQLPPCSSTLSAIGLSNTCEAALIRMTVF